MLAVSKAWKSRFSTAHIIISVSTSQKIIHLISRFLLQGQKYNEQISSQLDFEN